MTKQPRQFRTSFASRERNRVHARKTRQSKKEQMLTLTTRADELKTEQVRLKQSINEKNTASILVGLFATAGDAKDTANSAEDPRVEHLLKRKAEDIPDASKITELPALILPGQHNSKKVVKTAGKDIPSSSLQELLSADDGIDYQLLGKDRAKCTPEELDKIRRERNRMHAKRTRDRKRLFMEEMSDMCKQLEDENTLLRRHLQVLDGETPEPIQGQATTTTAAATTTTTLLSSDIKSFSSADTGKSEAATMDQFKTLLDVAGSLEKQKTSTGITTATTADSSIANKNSLKGILYLSEVSSSAATAVSASDSNNTSANASISEHHEDNHHHHQQHGIPNKRRRINSNSTAAGVPRSITTSAPTVHAL